MNIVIKNNLEFIAAVQRVRDLVACTAGPYGKNVQFFNGAHPITLRDGLQVMREYIPVDAMEANVLTRLQQRAAGVVARAGDGTTSMTVLTAAIYLEAMKDVVSDGSSEFSRRGIGAGIRAAAAEAVKFLREMAIPVTQDERGRDMIGKVATLAAGNDAVVGKVVADLMWQLGSEGVVHPEFSETATALETEQVDGFTLPGGAYHAEFVSEGRGKMVLNHPYIVVIRDVIQEYKEIAPMVRVWNELSAARGEGRPLLFVCANLQHSALNTLIRRETGNGTKAPIYVATVTAGMGDYLYDLALTVDSSYFAKGDGGIMMDDFARLGLNAFGTCDKVIMSLKETVFMGLVPEFVGHALSHIASLLLDAPEDKIAGLHKRAANIDGKIGVVRMPFPTWGAGTFLKEVVEDSHLACRSAFKSGVLPGAGRSLIAAGFQILDGPDAGSASFLKGWIALCEALPSVMAQLLSNGGLPASVVQAFKNQNIPGYETIMLNDYTLTRVSVNYPDGDDTLSSDVYGDAVEIGVLDSTEAVIAALENAAAEAAEWVETAIFVMPSVS